MLSPKKEYRKYGTPWFQDRALRSLKKIKDGVWDYSDSLLLYTPDSEGGYESMQKGEDLYAKVITEPEREYLISIADRIVTELPEKFEFIDLGPGTANKELYIFDASKRAKKEITYRPVDISENYLKSATDFAIAQHVRVKPVRMSFEELPDHLGRPDIPRFVTLGLTFSNYKPNEILELLKEIAGGHGNIFIDVQLRDRVNMKDLVATYAHDVKTLADSKIRLLGLDPKTDVLDWRVDDEICGWYTLEHTNSTLEKIGLRSGDTLLVFQSLRYTRESFERVLIATNLAYTLFDTGGAFLGALLKT